MANEKNLKLIRTTSEAREKGRNGGVASAKVRKEKKLLRECLQELMQMEYSTSQGKKSGSEMLSAMLMKKAMSGDIKAFEVLRDTAGEKPVDKVMVADVDKSVIDEVEAMVKGESD